MGWKSTSGQNLEQGHTGRWSWQLSANGTLQQQVAAIPDGTYTLSVWVKATGWGGQLVAKGCGGTDSATPIPAGASFTNVKSAPISVSGGQCTVSVSAGSAQLTLDDFCSPTADGACGTLQRVGKEDRSGNREGPMSHPLREEGCSLPSSAPLGFFRAARFSWKVLHAPSPLTSR